MIEFESNLPTFFMQQSRQIWLNLCEFYFFQLKRSEVLSRLCEICIYQCLPQCQLFETFEELFVLVFYAFWYCRYEWKCHLNMPRQIYRNNSSTYRWWKFEKSRGCLLIRKIKLNICMIQIEFKKWSDFYSIWLLLWCDWRHIKYLFSSKI